MDIDLLKKYYRGECTEEETNQVLHWFTDPSQKEKILSSIELNWYKFEDEESDKQLTINEIKERLNARLSLPRIDPSKRVQLTPEKKNKVSFLLKVAASFLFLVISAYFLWPETESVTEVPEYSATSSNYLIKSNPKGRKLHIKLADGSMVTLNSESKISYKEENFQDGVRAVYLEGEAYFQIAKNDSVPFIVSTRNLTITALGTAFNVRTYSEESNVNVALENGKVKVEQIAGDGSADTSVILNPGQIVSYSKSMEGFSSIGAFDFEEQLGWKDGLLYFNGDDFTEVIKKLERWYGVEIIILNQDQGQGWSYSGRYKNVALENVLAGISYTKSFEYEIKSNKVYIKFT